MALLIATEATLFGCADRHLLLPALQIAALAAGRDRAARRSRCRSCSPALLVATTRADRARRRAAAQRGAPARAAWWLVALALACRRPTSACRSALFADDLGKFAPDATTPTARSTSRCSARTTLHVAVGLLLDLWLLWQAGRRAHQLPARSPSARSRCTGTSSPRWRSRSSSPSCRRRYEAPQAMLVGSARSGRLSLWFGVLGAPAAWAVAARGVGYGLTEARCSRAGRAWDVPLRSWTSRSARPRSPSCAGAAAAAVAIFRATERLRRRPPAGRIALPRGDRHADHAAVPGHDR